MTPVSDKESSLGSDDERQWVVEATRESGNPLNASALSQLDADELPAVAVAQVLPPERDEEVAAPERDPSADECGSR